MIQKKGQAAMEFLMTYGWALLVVLIAIGALAFFGVLNPGRFLPETCTLSPGFACTDSKVTTGVATIVLQNGLGTNINSGATLTIDGRELHTDACLQTSGTAGTILDGTSTTITVTINSGCSLTAGSKFKANMIFSYTPAGGTSHSKVGNLVQKVEAA